MAILKKRDKGKSARREAAKPVVEAKSQVQRDVKLEDVFDVLREIRDKMPSKEDQIFASVLSGVIAKRGPMNGDGKPAVGLAEIARNFAEMTASK